MRYLIDTNIIRFAMRQEHDVAAVLRKHSAGDLLLSAIVLGEGRAGATRATRAERWLALWEVLTDGWELAPFDAACAEHYGRIRADLERRGVMIGHRDCQIAATALAYAEVQQVTVTLVTDNLHEFNRVPGLKIVNWARR